MKNLHIMFNQKFISSYIKFINNNFSINENYFLIIGGLSKEERPIPDYLNVKYIEFLKKRNKIFNIIFLYYILFQKIRKSEKIYIHGLFDKKIIFFLYIFRNFLKKSNWIIWGGDLYCYEKRKEKSLWYIIEDYVKRNFGYVNTLTPGDYKIAKDYFNVQGKYKKAQYIIESDFSSLNNFVPRKKTEVYIQIGNSDDPSNNHFDILDTLSKFRNKNIRIFCILSCGSREYVKKVNEYGKKIFGKKFVGIFNFMSIEEYCRYLSNIDILILNHKRQQGLGTIFMSSYFEQKIYLRKDISSWDYLKNDLKLKINSYENIKNETFEEFRKNNSNGNKDIILTTVYSDKYVKNIWEDNFNN